eukprot:gene8360-3440_t
MLATTCHATPRQLSRHSGCRGLPVDFRFSCLSYVQGYRGSLSRSGPTSEITRLPVHVAGTQGQELSTTHNKSMTEQIFDAVDAANTTKQAGGAGGATTYETFKRVDEGWLKLRTMKEGAAAGPAPTFVQEVSQPLPDNASPTFDVTVCGGTLGIFAATALAQKGLKVAVIERGLLRGREQEWNISRKEMEELVKLGLLTMAELNECISNEFNPVRIGFLNGEDVWTKDVLNLGASPAKLIDKMRGKLEAAGGKIFERAILEGVMVHSNGASLAVKSASGGGGDAGQPPVLTYLNTVSTRLLVDCMGHQSPIVKQLRWGKKPDGVCLVVGSLSSGFENNKTADVIYTNTDLQPADANVTEYIDAQEYRPSLADVYEDYWDLMPKYQNVDLKDITPKRLLFGYFPTFRDSPMPPGFSRVLQIGDASGIQSPLSFGGFGAMTRHIQADFLERLERCDVDALDQGLSQLASDSFNCYNPELSSAWMLQTRKLSTPTSKPPLSQVPGCSNVKPRTHHLRLHPDPRCQGLVAQTDSLRLINFYNPRLSSAWMPRDVISLDIINFYNPWLSCGLCSTYSEDKASDSSTSTTPGCPVPGCSNVQDSLGLINFYNPRLSSAWMLKRASLGLINFYNPGLSSAWMLQRAMSVRTGDKVAPNLINRMLAGNFKAMEGLGDPVMKPFLQDVIQLGPLMSTLTKQMLTDPMSIPQRCAWVPKPGHLPPGLGAVVTSPMPLPETSDNRNL